MRTSNRLSLTITTSLVALLSGYGCSAEPEGSGNGNNPPSFGTGQGGGAGAGVGQVPGASGNTGAIPGGGGGTNVEGQGGNLGVAQGGSTGVGTSGAGGGAPAMDAPPQEIPGGYFASGAWRGYAWTGDDGLGIGTTRTPIDFSDLADGAPFCMTGTVGPDPNDPGTMTGGYEGVALLGFNINQEQFGSAPGVEPALGAIAPTNLGVAVNYTKASGHTLRIQLQGPNGATDASQRWCAELTEPAGPEFIEYTSFVTNCWPGGTPQIPYNMSPLSAVVMTIPGDDTDPIPYNVCVSGFADGDGEEDAPTEFSLPAGLLSGTMSGVADKVKVVGRDGNSYIVNNNAWGVNSSNGSQQIRYLANSFEILRQSAGPGGDSSPASFPSIYIGANGAQSGVNGATTTGDNPLPIQVSAINSLPTRFRNNATSGDYNATYDVWFAPSPPAGEYDTALAAFLMVWTYKPGGRVAIGNRNPTPVQVDGRNWFLYVGPRGGGGPDANLPVISYVNEGPAIQDYQFDLDLFITDAVARNVGLRNDMYLTDVFAGFEIWNGGQGLRVDEFTAVINP